MDEVAWHREPPSNIPTMVTAFGGWIDAGEAATGAMRFLVRQLATEPLAEIDPEDFVDFTQVRPVVRLTAEGERIIRWPRSAFWTWQPPQGGAGLLLFRGLEPQRRWRTYTTLLLDVAARCGVQRIVSLGAVLASMPHTRPPRVTGSSTEPAWQARFEACEMLTRRSRYEGPTGIATIVMDAARRRGMASCNVRGQAPHYLGGATNPAVSRALLTAVTRLFDLELDLSPFEAAVQAFRTQCDQAVAQDAATQAYVQQFSSIAMGWLADVRPVHVKLQRALSMPLYPLSRHRHLQCRGSGRTHMRLPSHQHLEYNRPSSSMTCDRTGG